MMKWIAVSPTELALLIAMMKSDIESIEDIFAHAGPGGNDMWSQDELNEMEQELHVASSVFQKLATA